MLRRTLLDWHCRLELELSAPMGAVGHHPHAEVSVRVPLVAEPAGMLALHPHVAEEPREHDLRAFLHSPVVLELGPTTGLTEQETPRPFQSLVPLRLAQGRRRPRQKEQRGLVMARLVQG